MPTRRDVQHSLPAPRSPSPERCMQAVSERGTHEVGHSKNRKGKEGNNSLFFVFKQKQRQRHRTTTAGSLVIHKHGEVPEGSVPWVRR